jgi:hypothetical protein
MELGHLLDSSKLFDPKISLQVAIRFLIHGFQFLNS